MPYPWAAESQKSQTEKIPPGTHRISIVRIVTAKAGKPFKSKGGDPQIMLIFADEQGREASQMITLSARAGWVLARLMSCCDIDVKKLEEEGIEIEHFASDVFCEQRLVGLSCEAEISYAPAADGKEYVRIVPVKDDLPF